MNGLFEIWEGTVAAMAFAAVVWGAARAMNGVSLFEPKFFPELSGVPPEDRRALIDSAEVLARKDWRVYVPDAIFLGLVLVSLFALEAVGWKFGIDSSTWWAELVFPCMTVLVCQPLAARTGPRFLRPYLQQVLSSPVRSGRAPGEAPPVV